jgi:transaldolase
MTKLEQLRAMTTVVADTGDIEAIRRYQPVDATTNPSLLLKVAANPSYRPKVAEAVAWAKALGGSDTERMANCLDKLAVLIGAEITHIVPGRISTEVSARLSFNTAATLDKARKLVRLYEEMGVGRERVLIKIAATWEGIRAAEQLEREGINCNLTLLFSFAQARACADAGVFLISPFVGRIYDWYKKASGEDYQGASDPGVQSVARIFNYYKAQGFATIVMGASFRNTGQIEALAGCDRLTISPQLLAELEADSGVLPRMLATDGVQSTDERLACDEELFRWQHNEDAMATEKLAEGIRLFHGDECKLETLITQAGS